MTFFDDHVLICLTHGELSEYSSLLEPDRRGKVYTGPLGDIIVDSLNDDGSLDLIARRDAVEMMELRKIACAAFWEHFGEFPEHP